MSAKRPVRVGIVGHEAVKFLPHAEAEARALIARLLPDGTECVSGRCPLGGVDVWAEEVATALGRPTRIFPPAHPRWRDGFKPRNLQIAGYSDVLHVIVVDQLPATYTGLRFPSCYHCHRTDHVKSGACWTAQQAIRAGKDAEWHIIPNHE